MVLYALFGQAANSRKIGVIFGDGEGVVKAVVRVGVAHLYLHGGQLKDGLILRLITEEGVVPYAHLICLDDALKSLFRGSSITRCLFASLNP